VILLYDNMQIFSGRTRGPTNNRPLPYQLYRYYILFSRRVFRTHAARVCMHNMPRDANVGPVELTHTNRMHKRYRCRVRHNILLLLLLLCEETRYYVICILCVVYIAHVVTYALYIIILWYKWLWCIIS